MKAKRAESNAVASPITPKVYSQREAAALFGVSIATWKRYVAAGRVPRPIRMGPRRVGWLDHELAATQEALRKVRDGQCVGS
jgi:predicted DNA-binding transcriptional regulator AlpA